MNCYGLLLQDVRGLLLCSFWGLFMDCLGAVIKLFNGLSSVVFVNCYHAITYFYARKSFAYLNLNMQQNSPFTTDTKTVHTFRSKHFAHKKYTTTIAKFIQLITSFPNRIQHEILYSISHHI